VDWNIFYGFAGVSNTVADVAFIALFLLFSALVLIAAVWLLPHFIYAPKAAADADGAGAGADGERTKKPPAFNYAAMLWLLLAIGFILRLIFVFVIKGYRAEYNALAALCDAGQKVPLADAYKSGTVSHYPLVVYLYSLAGAVASVFGVTEVSFVMPLFVKLPLILADLAAAALFYHAAKKYVNEAVGLIIAGVTLLFPAFIFASAVWGSVFSLLALFAALAFYFVAAKNYPAAIGFFSLCLLTHSDALYIYPVVAVFLIYNYIKHFRAVRAARPQGFSALMRDKDGAAVVLIPAYIIVSTALIYLVTLPLLGGYTANFFKWLNIFYFKPLAAFGSFGHNALNIFNLFGRNGVELVTKFPSAVFASLFGIITTALVLLVYLSRKNRANLAFLAAFVLLMLSVFYMGFSELNLMPALALLLLSFILIKDKRILQVFGLISLGVTLNAGAVMASAGHLGNASDYDLSSANAAYTGKELLNADGGLAVSVIASLIVISALAYAMLILLDLSMSNRRKLFKSAESTSLADALKNFFSR
jgi:Gpi18-like mannosyltransferase